MLDAKHLPYFVQQLKASQSTFFPVGGGHLITWNGPMMSHLNSFSASGVGYLNKNFPNNNSNARGVARGGGMFKLQFDWYIILSWNQS